MVRIGAGGRKDRGVDDDGPSGNSSGGSGGSGAPDVSQMSRVVERLHLDYLTDERRRAQTSARAVGGDGRALSAVEIKKNILERADVVCATLSGAGSQPILEVGEGEAQGEGCVWVRERPRGRGCVGG